ncbi:hypothetical protein JAAARDRAFT_603915 [Jaapia argillacea MUCL 33604]|uniref:MYND-type domain-containing protein n=1 Tax=Jaapia argillacea MUCL 33604 TaxID=933084 RepID=A0A067QA10_9AGAM|nr:hypothetical protein JAAARDRAFT_603915 [Jaapia argillacea MUCL 33604]
MSTTNPPTEQPILPDIQCRALYCGRSKKLRKCARCKNAYYCSTECQRKHWSTHKPQCDISITTPSGTGDEPEPLLRRHCRYWIARFCDSISDAMMFAFNLTHDFSNISKYGLLITLHPRPHPIIGARFHIHSITLLTLSSFAVLLGSVSPGTVEQMMKQHHIERQALQEQTNGEQDSAPVLIFAVNKGEHKIPSPDNSIYPRLKFRSIAVVKSECEASALPYGWDPKLDWRENLQKVVDEDLPIPRAPPPSV